MTDLPPPRSVQPDKNIFEMWFEEAALRHHICDIDEPTLDGLIFLSTITRSTSATSSETRHVSLQSTVASERPPRRPAELPQGDCRFLKEKKDRIYVCDRCDRKVRFNKQTQPFRGAYLRRTWKKCEVVELKAKWKAGEIDATFYCIACLASEHQGGVNEASRRFLFDDSVRRRIRAEKFRKSRG